MNHAYVGKRYTDQDINSATAKFLVRIQTPAERCENICRETAQLLADQRVIGWFQGGSEFGPRALGNRSLLADPRKPEMKDILNKRVKHRQAFRPFAPIVLAERARENAAHKIVGALVGVYTDVATTVMAGTRLA
jgi:carbamoyltransferase